jgi:hypothetical protein
MWAIAWAAAVLLGFAGVAMGAQVLDAHVLLDGLPEGRRVLDLGPSPWVGFVLAVLATAVAAWPTALWLQRGSVGRADAFSRAWGPSRRRQLTRLVGMHVLVLPLAFATWMAFGVRQHVVFDPFTRHERELAPLLTCDSTVPADGLWAHASMCRWSAARTWPGIALASLLALLAL